MMTTTKNKKMDKRAIIALQSDSAGRFNRDERLVEVNIEYMVGENHTHMGHGAWISKNAIKACPDVFKECIIEEEPHIRVRAYRDFIYPIKDVKGRIMDIKKHNAFMLATDELFSKFPSLDEDDKDYLSFEVTEEDLEIENAINKSKNKVKEEYETDKLWMSSRVIHSGPGFNHSEPTRPEDNVDFHYKSPITDEGKVEDELGW